MVPAVPGGVEHTLIVSPIPDAKYLDFQCEGNKCGWTREYFEAPKAQIEAVPPGRRRHQEALEQIKPLGEEPFTVDEEAAKSWLALAEASKDAAVGYPDILAETL